jgi:hypothetical protein
VNNPRLSDVAVYAPQQQRGTDDIEHNSNDAERVPYRVIPVITTRRKNDMFWCAHPDCSWRGLPQKPFPTAAAADEHFKTDHHNKPIECRLVCPVTGSAVCRSVFGVDIAEYGLEQHLLYEHSMTMAEGEELMKVLKKLCGRGVLSSLNSSLGI